MIVAVPIPNGNGAIDGAIILNAPVQGMNAFLTQIYWAIALTGLLALALTVFIVRRLSGGIVRPLRSMEETAAAMAQGCYDRRVEVTTQDEVGQLGDSLNTLAQELSNFVARTEQMEKLRRDFVANVSHELRSPLTALLGFIETLQGPARDDPVARERFLVIMSREAGRMTRIVRDLLSLSRVESEERVRPTGRVDLAALVSSAVQTLRPLAESQSIALTVEGASEPVFAAADPDQITQVFTNLIENALKYGGTGKRVVVSLERREGVPGFPCKVAAISVQDWGEGIDEVHLPRLTERFYRVDSHRSREKGGTGLGLAIVKHIIHRHRGRLKIISHKGEGSRFTVFLPLD